ncbi:MAG: inositol phosphorylceramide synthase [Bacteroidetes bacterium]|nr:inositol phosphorylceramide synthase [Bacteroidota bacterium]
MQFKRFTRNNIILNLMLVLLFATWASFLGGLRSDQLALIALYLGCFYATEKSRKFILGFSIFIVFWIVYDSMRVLPNYEISTVHIREPYALEKFLFGIQINDSLLTPNEYFTNHTHRILDLLSGLFYINWMPIPLAFAVYLFIKDKHLFIKFSLVFLLTNLVGFAIYYIYPAAPPWYIDLYGFDLKIGVPGFSAGLNRFDEFVGIPVFANIYNKNSNVLAAIPSLHAAYPVIVLYYGIRKRLGWINLFFAFFMIGIWFSAVYTGHHYIIDIAVGVAVALIVTFTFERLSYVRMVNNWLISFENKLT